MNTLPVDFWPQLWARLRGKNPKFFDLIQRNAYYVGAVALLLPIVLNVLVSSVLPGLHIPVPVWLVYLNDNSELIRSFLLGLSGGSAFVSQTTIVTASTPDLSVGEKPTVESLTKEMRLMQEKLDRLDPLQAKSLIAASLSSLPSPEAVKATLDEAMAKATADKYPSDGASPMHTPNNVPV